MSAALRRHLVPFQPMTVVFDTPKRPGFSIQRFKGVLGAFKLLWYFRKHKQFVRAETAYNDAMTAHSIGRFNQAEELYNLCLKLQPDHEPALTNLAALYLERNSEALAVGTLKRALAVRPYYYRGYYNLGLVYWELGKTEDAIAMLEQALNYNESHFYSYIVLAEIHVVRNEIKSAIELYLKAEPWSNSHQALYIRLAELYLNQQDLNSCEQYLRSALDIKELPELYFNLGWVLAQQWRDPEALVDCFSKARRSRHDFKEAGLNLALCQAASGLADEAVASMTKYLSDAGIRATEDVLTHFTYLREIDPSNQAAAMRSAELYLQTEQVQKAIDILNDLLEKSLALPVAVQMLADIYRDVGRHKDAILTYKRLFEMAPSEVNGYLGLARCFADISNFTAAMPVLRKVLEIQPNNIEVNYQYATLLAQEGNLTLALKHYKQVAAQDPNHPRIQKRLRMLEEELEDEETTTPQAWPQQKRGSIANMVARENAENESQQHT